MVTSPEVSWLFFKARAKRQYPDHTGRASNAENSRNWPGPEGCDENGPAAALLVGYVPQQVDGFVASRVGIATRQTGAGCALLAPCRRPILNATPSPLFARRYARARRDERARRCKTCDDQIRAAHLFAKDLLMLLFRTDSADLAGSKVSGLESERSGDHLVREDVEAGRAVSACVNVHR